MCVWFAWVCVAAAVLSACEGLRVLVVFPMPSKSHGILGAGVVKSLLEAGHEVTYMTPYLLESQPRLKQIDLSFTIKILWENNPFNIKDVLENNRRVDDPTELIEVINRLNKEVVACKDVQAFLADEREQFDVVLVEWLFSEYMMGFAAVFNCPYIWVSSMEPHWAVLVLIDEVTNPAYVPSCVSTNHPPFTFFQRVQELFSQAVVYFFTHVYLRNSSKADYEAMFGHFVAKRGWELPPYEILKYNASLMLGNSHASLGQATPLPQSYKDIGGYHIEPDVKALPEKLKKIMDNAKHGVIYFSMGSNLKSQDLPDQLKIDLLKMFGQHKQTVIWKFEDVLPNLPGNVHIVNWAPQPSILAHPKCVLFITHGGLLSTTEAVHFGVPIIGVPVFADQFNNIERAVGRGFARRVHLSHNMVNDLKREIGEILSNPRYTKKAKELSAIYHDRPVPPRRELVHWVEHVVASRGAPHLRSPALLMPWYQKMFFDLLCLIVIVISIVIIALRFLCCRRNQDPEKIKKL